MSPVIVGPAIFIVPPGMGSRLFYSPITIKPSGSTVMVLAEIPPKASAWHEIGRLRICMNVSTRIALGAIG